MQYLMVKHSHVFFVVVTVVLFNLRFWLKAARPDKPLPGILKVLPHLNDTMLLFTGLWLMKITGFMPFGNANWLGMKIVLLIAYIFLGALALKAQARSVKSVSGYAAATACIAVIAYMALYKPI
ncbi:SirB2 family protein [Neisseria weaveri]|uniref:SirB2 family protein n=1 Tax=Neisseria weaveri TaxID=28091 RepID=UPI000D2FEC11|nr:SirB2 family protein [Neisseria weaveri]